MSKITSKVGLLDSLEQSINPATEDSLDKLVGFEIPAHNYQAFTYVAAGNGAGEVETIVYKTGGSGGTTVATKTYAYDASNRVSSVTKT